MSTGRQFYFVFFSLIWKLLINRINKDEAVGTQTDVELEIKVYLWITANSPVLAAQVWTVCKINICTSNSYHSDQKEWPTDQLTNWQTEASLEPLCFVWKLPLQLWVRFRQRTCNNPRLLTHTVCVSTLRKSFQPNIKNSWVSVENTPEDKQNFELCQN